MKTISAPHNNIGVGPIIFDNFLFLEQNAPSAATHAPRYMPRGFSRMSRGKNGVRNSRNRFMLFSFGPQLNAFMAVGTLHKYFRRKLLMLE